MKRITYVGYMFAIFTLMLGSSASAQDAPTTTQSASAGQQASQTPEQPLGDYARKLHSSKDKDANANKKAAKVFDNDNLPMNDKISVVGQTDVASAANDASAKPADAKDASKNASSDEDKKQAEWKGWHDKVASQKDQIDLANRELDVLQREYQLRAAEMYADAGNRLRNSGDWDKKDAQYKQQIADKQKALDDAKQKLEDIQEGARKAGVPSSMIE